MFVLLLINIILLLTFKLLNIYVSYHLYENIDDYVLVYNYFKNISRNNVLLCTVRSNKKFIIKYRNINYTICRYRSIRLINTSTKNKIINSKDYINLVIQTKTKYIWYLCKLFKTIRKR